MNESIHCLFFILGCLFVQLSVKFFNKKAILHLKIPNRSLIDLILLLENVRLVLPEAHILMSLSKLLKITPIVLFNRVKPALQVS